MLTKLVDLSQVTGYDEYGMMKRALDIDIHKRLPRYNHTSKPSNAEAFRVVARNRSPCIDSFTYEITYGTGDTLENFRPLGSPIVLTDGELPPNR